MSSVAIREQRHVVRRHDKAVALVCLFYLQITGISARIHGVGVDASRILKALVRRHREADRRARLQAGCRAGYGDDAVVLVYTDKEGILINRLSPEHMERQPDGDEVSPCLRHGKGEPFRVFLRRNASSAGIAVGYARYRTRNGNHSDVNRLAGRKLHALLPCHVEQFHIIGISRGTIRPSDCLPFRCHIRVIADNHLGFLRRGRRSAPGKGNRHRAVFGQQEASAVDRLSVHPDSSGRDVIALLRYGVDKDFAVGLQLCAVLHGFTAGAGNQLHRAVLRLVRRNGKTAVPRRFISRQINVLGIGPTANLSAIGLDNPVITLARRDGHRAAELIIDISSGHFCIRVQRRVRLTALIILSVEIHRQRAVTQEAPVRSVNEELAAIQPPRGAIDGGEICRLSS